VSAIVTSDEDEDWFVNNRGWSIILDCAMRHAEPEKRNDYEKYTNPIGIDFTFIDPPKRPEVAQWLLRAVEALCGPEAAEQGWDTEKDRAHLEELAVMLRRMTRA
jgi:hypothetical protein